MGAVREWSAAICLAALAAACYRDSTIPCSL